MRPDGRRRAEELDALHADTGSRMRPVQSGCSRCHAPSMCMAASIRTGSMATRGSGFERNQRSRGCTSSVPSIPSRPMRSSERIIWKSGPWNMFRRRSSTVDLHGTSSVSCERQRLRRVGIAVREHDDRFGSPACSHRRAGTSCPGRGRRPSPRRRPFRGSADARPRRTSSVVGSGSNGSQR